MSTRDQLAALAARQAEQTRIAGLERWHEIERERGRHDFKPVRRAKRPRKRR